MQKGSASQRSDSALFFLLGLRHQLVQWVFARKAVKVKDDNTLVVSGTPVLSSSVRDYKLVINWLEDGWQQWEELKASSEFKALVEKANENLRKAEAGKGKGDGKGKNSQ